MLDKIKEIFDLVTCVDSIEDMEALDKELGFDKRDNDSVSANQTIIDKLLKRCFDKIE